MSDTQRTYECDVCGNTPDEEGWLLHGKGCYTQSEEGGGTEYIEGADMSLKAVSDTPRTDALSEKFNQYYRNHDDGNHDQEVWELAETLERELSAERKRADEAISAGRKVADYNMELLTLLADANRRADEAERDAKLLMEQNAQLAELNQGQFLQLEYLRPIFDAAKKLSDETEEYDFADGLGQGALQEYWDALNTALEPKTDAIDEEMRK